jgi:hypothetical protein
VLESQQSGIDAAKRANGQQTFEWLKDIGGGAGSVPQG